MAENPYESTVGAYERIVAADLAAPSVKRPRVWTVFVAVVAALAAAIAAQAAVAIVYVVWRVAGGVQLRDLAPVLEDELSTPGAFIGFLLAGQLAMGMAAVIPAWWSPQPISRRLGLVRPRVPLVALPVIMIGALFPLAIGVALAELLALVVPPDPTAAALYDKMTWPWAIPFILFVALAPGFMEEMLFRGYMQTRLLQRWPAWVAILVTSAIFGVFHVMPHAVVNAFVIGLWLGVLAWRTGSIWPSIACHAFINGSWNFWNVGERLWGFPETPPVPLALAGGIMIVACFILSIWLLWRNHDRVRV
jgi:membrane protease YdiL (CAAX protease family)